jgi:ubiquinone/menaquinone biosynthesis C-methylase UbiE
LTSRFGNPLIDQQRQETEAFCSDPLNNRYFHIMSLYPGLEKISAPPLSPFLKKILESNRRKWREIEDCLPDSLTGLAFDAGCASSSLAFRCREKCRWIGGDFDRDKLLLGKYYLKEKINPLSQLNLLQLPFKDSVFDFISHIDVIEHIDEKETLLREMNRVLKKGGQLFIHSDNMKRTRLAVVLRRCAQKLKGKKVDWKAAWEGVAHGHNHLVTPKDIQNLAQITGFRFIKSAYLSRPPMASFRARFFYCLLEKI